MPKQELSACASSRSVRISVTGSAVHRFAGGVTIYGFLHTFLDGILNLTPGRMPKRLGSVCRLSSSCMRLYCNFGTAKRNNKKRPLTRMPHLAKKAGVS